jgi:N-acetylglucosamine kinase-like BadF-type ATPase
MADPTLKQVIGVDAGGSKTLALLVSETGEVIRRSRSGGANPHSLGQAQAARTLREALEPLLRARKVDAICLGAAGLARESDRDFFERTLRAIAGSQPRLLLRNDAQIALEAGTSERPAMVAIAGTGAMVYGERADGSQVRCGGYGAVIGDRAGGYAIGVRALRHAARMLDGLAQPGPLSQAILAHVDARDVPALVERIHRWPPEVGAIAALASVVGDAAALHDVAAQAIVRDACDSMREQVRRVAEQVRTEAPLPAVLCGGAFEAVTDLKTAAAEGCNATGPCALGRPTVEPAHGAALLALDALGIIHPPR